MERLSQATTSKYGNDCNQSSAKYTCHDLHVIKVHKDFLSCLDSNESAPRKTSFTINVSSILAALPIAAATKAANDINIVQPQGVIESRFDNIPPRLQLLDQWLLSDPQNPKRPCSIDKDGRIFYSGVNHVNDFMSFERAKSEAIKRNFGMGLCLLKTNKLVCYDFDTYKSGVPDDRIRMDFHKRLINWIMLNNPTYSEFSLSGKNFHIWNCADAVTLHKPKFQDEKGNVIGNIDILTHDCWVVFTGNTLNTGVDVLEANDKLLEFLSRAINQPTNKAQKNSPPITLAVKDAEPLNIESLNENDEAIKAKLLANVSHKQLWEHIPAGTWAHQSFPSQSEADLTLVIALAKLTSSNSQVIRLFRESGLGKRDKAYREDYVNRTIANARGIIAKEAEEYAGLDRFIENLFANANANANADVDVDVDVDSIAGTANSTDKKSDVDIDSTAETADSTVKESDVGVDSTADNTSSTESVDSNKFKTAHSTVDLLKHIDDEQLIKRMTLTLARGIQLPPSSSFLIGLAIFSSIATRVYRVTYRYGGLLPIGIYALAEQPPATAKTWLQSEFKRPFEDFDDERRKAHVEEIKQLQDWLDANRKHKEFNENKEKLIELKKNPIPVLFVTNATAEALEVSLTKTGGYFSLVSSEQTMVESVLGKLYGNELRANNNEVTLNGFDGGKSGTLRVGRETYSGRAIGGVALFAQNGSIETVLNASNGTGLSDRFLMLCEAHLLGTRDYITVPPIDRSITAEYDKLCTSIAQLALKDEREPIRVLTLSEYGYLRINEYKNYIEPDLADDAKYACHNSLRGGAGKADMKIMKIAANLHLLDGGMDQSVIADKHVIAAIKILDDLINAALGLCHDKGIVGIKAESEAIIGYISKRTKTPKMSEIYNSVRSTQPFTDMTGSKADAITKAVNDMVERGELTFNPPVSKGSGTYSIT
jgi:primase-polymerase (primpol)-like protein